MKRIVIAAISVVPAVLRAAGEIRKTALRETATEVTLLARDPEVRSALGKARHSCRAVLMEVDAAEAQASADVLSNPQFQDAVVLVEKARKAIKGC